MKKNFCPKCKPHRVVMKKQQTVSLGVTFTELVCPTCNHKVGRIK
jgi:DNA-directed RNA polymerase subunit M/transcription elongation factor TFIIS